MSNDLIVIDNAIVTSAYSLSLNELRLIYSALKQIPKGEKIDPKKPFYITKDDFIELGANPTQVAREIRAATKELMRRTLVVPNEDGDLEFHWLSEVLRYDKNAEVKLKAKYPNPEDHNVYISKLRAYNLLDSISYRDDDDIVARIVFHERIVPLLSDLKKSFTQLMIKDVKRFSSVYSHRIYQLMMQYKSTGYVKISINDLRFMLVLSDKYPLTADLKRRVIDTAIDEINEKSPYKVNYILTKKGRKFNNLELTFKLKKDNKDIKPNDVNREPNTPYLFYNLTDKEREIVANKNAYADSVNADDLHRQNLIKKGLESHREVHRAREIQEKHEKQKKKDEQVQVQEQIKQAKKDYEKILADDSLINEFIKLNAKDPKFLQGIERFYYDGKDYKNLFITFKNKFENPSFLRFLDLSMIKK